jgi:hypothetical protein
LGYQGYLTQQLYVRGKKLADQQLGPVTIDPNSAECQFNGGSRLEPPTGRIILGFHLDWSQTTPEQLRDKLGSTPGISNAFLRFDPTIAKYVDYEMLEWHAQQVRLVGGALAMTFEPSSLGQITDQMINELAEKCLMINSKYGVPMYVRWGHEMNGDWTNYGYQPVAYTESYRRVSRAIHARTNMTAMVWGPNLGINYPFTSPSALVQFPNQGTEDFRRMDTNGNGRIDAGDDPYLPYYPGDEFVDWVALSLYWYPDANTGYNIVPPSTYFRDMLTSTGASMDLVNSAARNDPLRNFYQRFAADRNKPMMIPETAAPWIENQPARATHAEIKRAWYSQIFSDDVYTNFPLLKVVTQFEERKQDAGAELRDWRVMANSDVTNAFKDVLKNSNRVTYATDFQFTCGGAYRPRS